MHKEMETTRKQFKKIIEKYWDIDGVEISLLNTILYSVNGDSPPGYKMFIIEIDCNDTNIFNEIIRYCKVIGVDMRALEERRDTFF